MVQRIAHSAELLRQFEIRVQAAESAHDTRIKNLRAAKHRFESIAKPTGRYTLWHDCFLDLAQSMVVSRAGKVEADDAQRFLLEVDEENCIQIAMHADFADDCLCLTRYPCIHVHCGVGYATVTHMAPQPVSILAVASHPVPMDTCLYLHHIAFTERIM